MLANAPLWTTTSDDESTSQPEALKHAYFRDLSPGDQSVLGEQGRWALVNTHLELARQAGGKSDIDVIVNEHHATVHIVHPDIRYLVDSVSAELDKLDIPIALTVHPIFVAQHRDSDGQLTDLFELPKHRPRMSGDAVTPLEQLPASPQGHHAVLQSWIAIRTGVPLDATQAEQLKTNVTAALQDARNAHEDSRTMRTAATQAAAALREEGPTHAVGVDQAARLLEWMAADHFVFLGYREYDLEENEQGQQILSPRQETGLGILRGQTSEPQPLTTLGRQQIGKPQSLIVTKTNSRSRVYRNAYMDFIAAKRFDTHGNVIGERRFIGLWRPTLGTVPIDQVPHAHELADEVRHAAGFDPRSHSGEALNHQLERYPRDEMLQMTSQELLDTLFGVLSLGQRRKVKLFLRPDIYGRFMTAMVFLPRDRYNRTVRRRIQNVLTRNLGAESLDYNVYLDESMFARIFFRIQLPAGWHDYETIDQDQIEDSLVMAVRSWKEGVDIQAVTVFGEDTGSEAAYVWDEAFPPNYRVRFEVEDAMEDISRFTALDTETPEIYVQATGQRARMKVYSAQPITLTTLMPILGELGIQVLDEYPFSITPRNHEPYYLYDIGISSDNDVNLSSVSQLLEDTVAAALTGHISADAFNKLVLHQGVPPHLVSVLRAYGHYLRQLQIPNSLQFMAEVLLDNPAVTAGLLEYFQTRFSPNISEHETEIDGAASASRVQKLEDILTKLHERLESVPTLDADRLLRQYLTVMQATDRTNAYTGHIWLSFKLAPQRIPFAPHPQPKHEIWVHSPQVSGVHFRYGAIARGGVRWSDRREDFRTEVLSLVQTQQTKNSVIVPAGAKGGFYAHQLPDPRVDRQAWVEAGRDAYRTFIKAMLDITDNQKTVNGELTTWTRENIIRHDETDTYLVVAADKGTAGFSDTANTIAAQYDHWLGDAFASGGSVGYDHKGMGITARGAWESVKSHFSTLGVDVEEEPFTVVGIGDMSGDVFGNGMLRSPHTRLVAAFNHLHIFVDPNPEPEQSFVERQRLYDLPRSSWSDYDEALISAGGGVFDRTARSIEITPEMRQRFDIAEDTHELTPNQFLHTVLQAPVDLLYNGGIGTYIKGSEESHEHVGDRANDPIRVNGQQIRAKVVGEGGNLGATQAGRVEAAQHDVHINMDAIDNSGGVDASDHEVNIKILIDLMLAENLNTAEQRTELLLSMTDDVAELVLATNVAQNALLRLEEGLDADWLPTLMRHTTWLEENAGLKREEEAIPTDEELRERMRNGQGFVTPELAVLASYTKIQLMDDLLASPLVDDEWFQDWLFKYFPEKLQQLAGKTISNHPLSRHIIAMMVSNYVINTGGITTVFRAQEETGADAHTVVESILTAQAVYEINDYKAELEELPKTLDATVRWESSYRLRRLSDRLARWIIHHQRADLTMNQRIESYHQRIVELIPKTSEAFIGDTRKRFENDRDRFIAAGFPEQLAIRTARMFEAYSLMDIVDLATRIDAQAERVIGVFFALHDEFDVSHLLQLISGLSRQTRWESLSRVSMREDLYSWLTELTEEVLTTQGTENLGPIEAIKHWEQDHLRRVTRVREFLAAVEDQLQEQATSTGSTDLSMLTVVLRRLRTLIL